MKITFQTPYYLAGKQKQRFHSNQAEKAALAAGAAGAIGYGLGSSGAAQEIAAGAVRYYAPQVTPYAAVSSIQKAAYGAAGVAGAYGVYHAGRAALYSKEAREKKEKSKLKTGSASVASQHAVKNRARANSSYYTRNVKGKIQRVKKGR